ncbi:hypothetical protein T07_2153 [Trichinella nelsoni]|uniref:Uncharacterized protein n=1 Tax=Trichinella nelsoni TaxID=6336 RepID=A0A0V0SI39_9BILA|nr:hypothetical protein T07_2153 [Trichinella nelsoni]
MLPKNVWPDGALHSVQLVDFQNAISKNSIVAEQRRLQQQAQAIDFLLGIACTT